MKNYAVKHAAWSLMCRQHGRSRVAWILATWFGCGVSPKAPGTVGSLFSLPLAVMAVRYGGVMGIIGVALAVFVIGWWAVGVVLKTQETHDPGFVVIDETLGQVLTFLFVAMMPLTMTDIILGFILFRFFDILKPMPASFFDTKVRTAFGVMMDDVVAGFYAGLFLYLYRTLLG